jgi:hypothetical protein
MTTDEALDLALEALELLTDTEQTYDALDLGDKAITAIKQARSAPVQEPVAWVDVKDTHNGPYEFHGKELLPVGKHDLYTAAQRQWVGLEREIAAAVLDHCYGHGGVSDDMIERTTEVIKAKLKEMNT